MFSEGEPIKGVNFLLYSRDVKPEVNIHCDYLGRHNSLVDSISDSY